MGLSISSLSRARACPGSAVLPAAQRAFADAARGTELHAEEEANAPAGSMAEVAFAYDVAAGTAREIGRGIGRNYPQLSPTEIPGTTDLLTVEPDRVVIEDHKSGVGYHVAPARENLQLHAYALCAARVYGRTRALVRLRFIDQGGRTDEHELDALDLVEVARQLRAIWDDVMRAQWALSQGREPRVVTGDHCWRCPALARCPAQTQLALAVSTGAAMADLPVLELTRESVATGWRKLMQLKKLAGEVERVYRAFAAAEPVPLGDGRWLGPVSKRREELDGTIAANVLREQHGAAVAAAACEISTSKAAIERAVATVAAKGKKAAMVRGVLDAIAAAGGVRESYRTSVEEHEAEEPKGAEQ